MTLSWFFLIAEDCDAFGDRSTQSAATLESLPVGTPGSSHVSSQNAALRILSVHAQGGGQLVVEGHDILFTAAEVESLNSLSADCSVAKSLDCGKRLDCRKQLAVQVENSPSHSPSKSEAYSVTTPAPTIESKHLYDLSLGGLTIFCANARICRVCFPLNVQSRRPKTPF